MSHRKRNKKSHRSHDHAASEKPERVSDSDSGTRDNDCGHGCGSEDSRDRPPRNVLPDGQTAFSTERFPPIRLRINTASIDYSRDDNGFLGCCASAYDTIVTSVASHRSIEGAFINLRVISTITSSILVGHGAPGFINLGTGQNAPVPNKYLSTTNESEWASHASEGVRGLYLTLFGCEVAGGSPGATLLQRVANRVRKPVSGWTGLVWCSSDGRVWGTGDYLTANPGSVLAPVSSPIMYLPSRGLDHLKIWIGDRFEQIRLDDVISAEFSPIVDAPLHFVWPQNLDHLAALQQIDFENPLITDDRPASAVVGQLILKFRSPEGHVLTRPFRILGLSLLQDMHYPRVYYYTGRIFDSADK